MAQVCFCGCGRKVGLAGRRINGTGEKVDQALERHATYRALWVEHVPKELKDFDKFVAAGHQLRAQLADQVHDRDAEPADREAVRAWLKHAWKTDAIVANMKTGDR